ncbi:hypothetical protein [Mesorhizobium sp.]|uniref:hypothetical protein n=1 Tax=Mesorhizobium sp. TaxID=1871066 RepID=UPI000FE3B637|nr:hypothetical protein [Mesorhizobium sp.]RWH73432.1 MAG: hypothetical protein EOQ84_07415 [Mesorhizobium sp.]RWL25651.1 MAG: hypothetical protein EOR58_19635 [Mesorhizobium sp.]RWL36498.1 MAG: hypothetical protein EOR63_00690 [Mesorhizobium sp.]RWL40742.1 MAG: hypothetical protein EOR59_04595 [Mesorhizobium sp.]RWL54451.1 MAG: hypothetical protein EOR62_11880 [Mesorhizobium sp.]
MRKPSVRLSFIRPTARRPTALTREHRAQSEQDRKALDKIERAIVGIMGAIEDGLYQPSVEARMEDLDRQKAEITARRVAPTDVPDLHLNIPTLCGNGSSNSRKRSLIHATVAQPPRHCAV